MLGLISAAKTPIPLKGINVKVNITGTVAEVETSLTYFNEEDSPIEATFTFPVDDGSAVYKFVADIQGKKIVAEIQEKEKAEITYQDGVRDGKAAVLLKQDATSADIFQCMLGNLLPHAEATLVLAYVIELPQEDDGRLRFSLPTILNPRYSPDAGSTVGAEGASYTPPSNIPYTFSCTANVRGYQKISSVKSDGDTLNVEFEESNHVAKVTLAEEFKFDHDLCFLVEYEKCFDPQVIMEIGKPEAAGLFKEDMLMLSFCPDLKEVPMATSGEYIFVIDRSGSMGGNKIKNAKEALLLFLKSLPADCYFNVVSFGSSFKTLFSASKKISEASLKEAIKLQEDMEADMGGTEILKPLESVYKQKAIAGHRRYMFVLTDGEVNNTDKVVGLVKKHAASVRVFALGIGSGASTALVNGIARSGDGKAEFIADGGRVQPKVISLLKCSMQPACSSVEFVWDLPPGVTQTLIPSQAPTLVTAGERLTLFAIMQGVNHHAVYGPSSVKMKGKLEGEKVSYTLTFTLADEHHSFTPTSPIHRLATKAQIKILEDEEGAITEGILNDSYNYGNSNQRELWEKIVNLSRHANIISKMTAFVAVDRDGEKVQGTMVERPCPVPTLLPQEPLMRSCCSYSAPPSGMQMDCSLADSGLNGGGSGRILRSATRQRSAMLDCDLDCDEVDSAECFLADSGFNGGGSGPILRSGSYDLCAATSSKKKKKGGFGFGSLFGCASKKKGKKGSANPEYALTLEPESAPKAALRGAGAVDGAEVDLTVDDDKMEIDANEEPVIVIDDEDDAEMEQNEKKNKDDATEILDDSQMLAVIAEQKLQGNWELTPNTAALLQFSQDKIKSSVSVQNESVACTLVVLVWLQKHFANRREEWQMIETKALAWLVAQPLGGTSVADLLTDCSKALWP